MSGDFVQVLSWGCDGTGCTLSTRLMRLVISGPLVGPIRGIVWGSGGKGSGRRGTLGFVWQGGSSGRQMGWKFVVVLMLTWKFQR